MTIEIKSLEVLTNILKVAYHPQLIRLALWVVTRYSDVTFTSAYRRGNKGVHGQIPGRGLDIRSWIYKDPEKIVEDINKHFIYDPKRTRYKCAMFHNTGRGDHIHLQVHDRTEYLGG